MIYRALQESDYVLSSDEEGVENPVVQVRPPAIPQENLNRAHADAAVPPPRRVNDVNADMVIMFDTCVLPD